MTEPEPAANPQALAEELFPIMLDYRFRDELPKLRARGLTSVVVGIPWSVISSHEKQAQKNHSQTLRRLADRGGLGACEAVAIIEDREWRQMEFTKANDRLAFLALSRPAADRGQIVEECARVAERYNDGVGLATARGIADAIRALSPAPAQTEDKP